ncbi:MAG: cobalamin B12-binding domain-containing protein [Anaerolineales bacterium]
MKTVIAGALDDCVHVAGVTNFLRLAEQAGWETVFLGPAVPAEVFVEKARAYQADLVGVSYRLSPENGARLLAEFAEQADDLRSSGVRFVFGGTPPVARKADVLGFFDRSFDGTETKAQVLTYLKGKKLGHHEETSFPQSLIARVEWKTPYPLLRHHFGLGSVEETAAGIKTIAEAHILDVVSLGIDQEAQANFFHPERQNPFRKGAGGVPVRSADDYRKLYQASRLGNCPLMRTYTGTDDFLKLAKMYVETINIAWAAIPLFWFNRMDGRGPWGLEDAIKKHQELMSWYAERHIPVELNEPHHWGMREASDAVFVASAYLSAYNAKAFGVHDYIAQMMFNSPPGLSDAMDLAKMLAALEITSPLEDLHFQIWRQTRTGLLSYPLDMDAARAHLAASVYLQMALKPHIVHVVGYTEADHAVTAPELIASCNVAQRAIENAIQGQPDMTKDPAVQARKEELVLQAENIIQDIQTLAEEDVDDPLIDPGTLARAVRSGILDAPHLKNNPYAKGEVVTRIDSRGACVDVDQN